MERAVFKEQAAWGFVGCVAVRIVKRQSPVSPLGLEGHTPLTAVVVLPYLGPKNPCWEFFLLAKALHCQGQEEGPPGSCPWAQGCGPRPAALQTFLSFVVVPGERDAHRPLDPWGGTSQPPGCGSASGVRNHTEHGVQKTMMGKETRQSSIPSPKEQEISQRGFKAEDIAVLVPYPGFFKAPVPKSSLKSQIPEPPREMLIQEVWTPL